MNSAGDRCWKCESEYYLVPDFAMYANETLKYIRWGWIYVRTGRPVAFESNGSKNNLTLMVIWCTVRREGKFFDWNEIENVQYSSHERFDGVNNFFSRTCERNYKECFILWSFGNSNCRKLYMFKTIEMPLSLIFNILIFISWKYLHIALCHHKWFQSTWCINKAMTFLQLA